MSKESTPVGRVVRLWRYPVKSMGGCAVDAVRVDQNGVHGDRAYAVRDRTTGVMVSLDSAPELLHVGVRQSQPDATPLLLIPGAMGWTSAEHASPALSVYLLRDVEVVRRSDLESALSFDYGLPVRNSAQQGFADVAGAVHLVSSASLAWLDGSDSDASRVRANAELQLELPAFGEHSLLGRLLLIGSVVVQVSEVTERCGLLDASQPGRTARPGTLATVQDVTGGGLGVYAHVHLPGSVHVGDLVQLGGGS